MICNSIISPHLCIATKGQRSCVCGFFFFVKCRPVGGQRGGSIGTLTQLPRNAQRDFFSNTCRKMRGGKHVKARKFKGGICGGSHLAVTYGGELLYLRIFSSISPPSKRELPFLRGLKSRTHNGYCAVNHAITIMCADRAECSRHIRRYNNSPPYVTVNMAAAP